MIDLRRLEALVAVHRTGSVSGAAAALHYGQPTISHHLRRLEAETGAVLLQRVGRGVRLTPEGERLARRGEEVLGLLARAEAELAATTSLQSGRVRLAAFPSGAATLVPGAIALLAERHPGIRLDLVEAEPPEAHELLRAGEIDLALTFAYPDQPEPEQITVVPVVDDPLYLVTRADAAPGPAVDLADYAASGWIAGCERCRRELLSLCAEAGFTPSIAFASDDYVAVQSLVATGLGVTVLPGLALRAHQHAGVVRRRLDAHRRVQLATYGAPPRPAAVDAVAAALTEAAGVSR
ncbi:LysR family transcriptional regulator [Pimelobacter simplex]|uniref:Putative LysR-family transcriptional regulator n=2 Tax=Nocardioides simplex TaxID=2045 RepID=A0A0A1DM43_NOCSI|nr:LysR family transcriptional regulator [Pimelobacter simplex]AIY18456.1 putative LysR-family transcriptional regulator [Pimelobacter simplex]GEB16252.1 LysR family transcriptional regulator [Pimelobacter simplex]SFM34487.1 DNA-binding transcriptional regulator, LysR family [Pimelobacter simplex]